MLWKQRIGLKRQSESRDTAPSSEPLDVLVCGWSVQAVRIVRVLIEQAGVHPRNIAVLADYRTEDIADLEARGVRVIDGDPNDAVLLAKAGIFGARTVVVPSNLDVTPDCADSRAITRVLAVEYLHPKVHSVVEILNSESEVRLELAHADEVISLDRMCGELLVACTMTHGLSWIIRDLLAFNDESECYRCDDLPADFVGKSYRSLIAPLAHRGWLLIGFETALTEALEAETERRMMSQSLHDDDKVHVCDDMTRAILLNPQRDRIIMADDALFLIAKDKPVLT